ncbi:unnamed protein product [Diamesa serratosioi]
MCSTVLTNRKTMELVFMHLSGKELKTMSEVCPAWYDIIAQSKICMAKLKLVIVYNERKPETMEIKEVLINSARKYQHITMYNENSIPVVVPADDLLILTKSGRNWTEVKLKCLNFETNVDMINFFGIFEPTVTKMYLSHINFKYYNDCIIDFKFPKLKILKTRLCTSTVQFDMFSDCKTLVDFKMQCGKYASCENEDNLRNLLYGNKELKVLTFDCVFFYRIFEEDISKGISFQLKELKTTGIQQKNDLADKNFNMFLHTQSQCLEKLNLGTWLGRQTIRTVFSKLNVLQDLTICKYELIGFTVDNNLHDMDLNLSIKTLNIGCGKSRILKLLIASCPNTRSLTVGNVNHDLLVFASNHLQYLERVQIGTEKSPAEFIRKCNLFSTCKYIRCLGYIPIYEV